MSTFSGVVEEIPFIRVDRYSINDEDARVFFISHCHSDHMNGLDVTFFEELKQYSLYLYGSPISVRILKNMFPDYGNQLKELHVGETELIKSHYKGKRVYMAVSVIPAGHCPGSVMFLFEANEKRILYTGDFRIDNSDKFFNKYFMQKQKIDTIYLDTTFCKKEYSHFPTRKQSLDGISEVVENWLSLNGKHVVKLEFSANFGAEYLIMELSKRIGHKIHVPKLTFDLYKFIPNMDGIVTVNNYDNNLKIHVGHRDNPCCNLYLNHSMHVCTIRISAWIWESYESGQSVIRCEEINYYRACISFHASYEEICEFIRYLTPVRIEACVLPKDETESRAMLELLENMLVQYKNKIIHQNLKINEPHASDVVEETQIHQRKVIYKDDLLSSPPRKFQRKRFSDTELVT